MPPSAREHAASVRTPSEEQWLRVSEYLRRERFSLAVDAARGYPDADRLAGTPLLSAAAWRLPAPVPLASIRLEFTPGAPPPVLPDVASVAPFALPTRADGRRYHRYCDVIESLAPPAVFENRPIYRLVAAGLAGPDPWLGFARGRFFDGVNVGGPAGFEYAAAALGVTDRCRYRDAFGDPTNLNVRSSAMATSALTLRYDRATGTATFPMHYRDPALVGHAGGLYQVIPVGIFQPSGEASWNEANDFDLWRGLLREYAEELLGASEEYGSEDAPIDYAAWPLARAMTDALATGQLRAWCLGLGTDPLTFAMDLLAVVVIDAPLYDELFGGLVAGNAEGRVIAPRPFDEGAVKELTTRAPLQAAAAALLTLAHEHRDVLLALQIGQLLLDRADDRGVAGVAGVVEQAKGVSQAERGLQRTGVGVQAPCPRVRMPAARPEAAEVAAAAAPQPGAPLAEVEVPERVIDAGRLPVNDAGELAVVG